jgi:hypothetical protein
MAAEPEHQYLHADYSHFSNEEWSYVETLAIMLGPAATDSLLNNTPISEQLAAIRSFMLRETRAPPSQHASSVKPLKIDVSKYSGSEKDSLPRWFLELDMAIAARQITDNSQQVAYALSNIVGRARAWALGKAMHNPAVFPTLAALQAQLSAAFQPPKSEFRSRQQFLAVKQGKRSLYDYIQEVRSLVSDVVQNPIDPATQVSVFLQGLQSGPVRTQLFRAYPNSLEDAINLALQEDFSFRQSHTQSQGVANNFRAHRASDGPVPMDIGMIQQANRGNPVRQGSVRCFKCNNLGHIARNCPRSNGTNNRVANGQRHPAPARVNRPRAGNVPKNENRQ